jgi:hypothetical protein
MEAPLDIEGEHKKTLQRVVNSIFQIFAHDDATETISIVARLIIAARFVIS